MGRKTRRRSRGIRGGSSCGAAAPMIGAPPQVVKGGRRKTRKMSTGADTWRAGVMRVYKEMKAKKPSTRFGDALKEASRRKKAGNL